MDTAYLCCNHVVLCITFAEFQIYMDLCAWDLSVEENTTAKNEIIGFIVNASKRKRNSNFLTPSLIRLAQNLFVFVALALSYVQS